MMRRATDVVSILLGDPAGVAAELKDRGTIATTLADEILEFTQSGINQITISELS
jgi:hypothetical protein